MAEILSDKQILKILEKAILNADSSLINPNGIELRLGKYVYFHSTDEEFELSDDYFLKIHPGETVSFSSLEKIDFSQETINEIFPGEMLMGFITPTTTMMREGISQVSTKIDAGFKGILNWSLRSGSYKEIIIKYGEPIFKLTVFKLNNEEVPAIAYGERSKDSYQNTNRIQHSIRTIPASMPNVRVIQSTIEKINIKNQLLQVGYPFNFINNEISDLQIKNEILSKELNLIKEDLSKKNQDLYEKLSRETDILRNKIDESETKFKIIIKKMFRDRLFRIIGITLIVAFIIYLIVYFYMRYKLI